MATKTYNAGQARYGNVSWGGSADPVLIGNNMCVRLAVNTGISGLGTLKGLSMVIDVVTPSASALKGNLYATADANVVGKDIASNSNASYIGTWDPTSASSHTMTIGDFRGAALASRIGTATTWYLIFQPASTVTAQYNFLNRSDTVSCTLTYDPGLVSVYNGTSWVSGTPYVWNGSAWVRGMAYVWNGSVWKLGLN